ncbi:MAG: EamA family transporter [Verrucomicrobia bacterium]|nr:EamA family transporter [Verrucomicrobiota bacterium]
MYIFLVVFMYATWANVFSLGKMALEHSPPLFLTAARMLLAAILLLTFIAIRKRSSFRLSVKQILSLGLFAVFGMYLTNAFEFWSLQHLTAAKTCFIYSLCPFFSALFSYLHFGEKMNRRKWLGMAIGFLGFIPVLSLQTGSEELIQGFSFLSWPELAMMGAALCTSYGWVLLRILVKDSVSPMMANGVSMLIGGLFALIHSYLVEPWNPLPVASSGILPFTQGILIMTLISNIICYNLYGLMLKRFTATFVSFMGLLSPIFASLSGWVFLGEPLSPVIFFATGIVSLGLWMVYSAELRQGYIRKAEPAKLEQEAPAAN